MQNPVTGKQKDGLDKLQRKNKQLSIHKEKRQTFVRRSQRS